MSADAGAAPGPDCEDSEGSPGPGNSYRDNQQRVGQGFAVMGGIAGDTNVFFGVQPDEDIPKPRLREGPYPADDVHVRLRGFVEPPTHTQCRKVLDRHVLVLRAGSGTGAGTAAFALLAERYGAGGITGLDSPDDLSRWRPKERRGYLLQGLSPVAAASLGEVALTALASLLRRTGAHLVITVRMETALPGDTVPWQVTHRPPPPAEVAARRLSTMAEAGELTAGQEVDALRYLASPDFTGYLDAHPLPGDGVDVAEGLRDLVVAGKSAASVLDDLRAGSPAAARKALAEARHRADRISLMAAISLLPEQDRTVVEQFGAVLRPLIDGRGGPAPVMAGGPEHAGTRGPSGEPPARHDVLGPALEDRLTAVGARLLPPRFGAKQRYPVQPVAFSGRHRSDALLRSLWLDYEGMADLLWKGLDEVSHRPGIELAAGEAIGKVLAHATGPDTLRQLHPFAASEKRWRRRLVAYALGEMVQHPALTGAVREQLRNWSQAAPVPLRCTVAETCAGSYGLARPAAALKLLDTALDRPVEKPESPLRTAVSFALSTLLSEDANHTLVLDFLREWQGAGAGTQRHAQAVHVIQSMSRASFPPPNAPGVRRLRLADLLAIHPERAHGLVVAALDDPATHDATVEGLSLIESDPDLRQRAGFPHLLAVLAAVAQNHRGVLRYVLRRHRARTASSTERLAS
ncbi:hypothetical protein OG978_21410 [Streptomyces sp. NBC_01591]|uniref:hypothetical protein n=1 Tax=Streptomyces sp. NBC_01591 TaxID=2975888 RepID=UPI002DD88D0F|nr:hypothetical protein [Streptomyces sp. NBC_01591]WSD69715.1 hypothetical protein OG978_21410 [Streptomyces sp. NBC_01591]